MATYQTASASAWVSSRAAADAAIANASATSRIRVALAINQPAASRMLAGRIGAALVGGPGSLLVAGLTVGAALAMPEIADWWKDTNFEWSGGTFLERIKTKDGVWIGPHDNREYASAEAACRSSWPTAMVWGETATGANCGPRAGESYGQVIFRGRESTEVRPVDYDTKVRPAIEGIPMPAKLPNIVWPMTWPVDDPVINPGTDGKPQPIFIPTGNPVKNPQFDSSKPVSSTNQPYLQPGIRVVPAPTTDNPWQVDIQPINRPVSSPDANPNPITDQPSGGDNDKPREDDRDLCQRNPDILACAKPELDTPDGEIPKTTKDVSYQPESLFGGGSCPANKVMSIHGQQITVWDWEQSCGWITGAMRPIVLVLCGFAAFVIVSAGAKS